MTKEQATQLLGTIAGYLEILRKDPHSTTFVPLSDAYRNLGMLDEALAIARQGIEALPFFSPGYVVLGRAQMQCGALESAACSFERALQIDPGSVTALKNMAKLCVFRGQRARALELYERAAELAPEDPVLANLKASLQPAAEMACHATCETDAAEPEQQEPVFATATVAELCLRQGHLEKAHAIYQNLHQANPADEAIRERLAHVASLLGAEALDTAAESTSHSAGTESSASDDDAPHAVVATLQKWLLAIKARREHVQKHSAGHC
ncbi:tetratricopeptide repeat protein [Syntrophotalea acetylenica]|jgi:tetratricopeptide (TPR) repeat protein|uniref:Uncharacterized protein n=1 Tax=Syntrophotalea acetylenica TaxID=29542 RepID=A0A1L3GHI8_SYNAC|nr:tetratricopeptide repeat protein [Syntrophotalea acetylenica]APG25412.1 hypothetical protein A7E75_10560 [Syntrophotalea acetylenica]APG43480.1 hypothetical protein A6070_04565 [Syntrophotalea acetylenica]MDY0262703.1 tetratricopeptide repeat protein [Syntrophotalea acetylenica]